MNLAFIYKKPIISSLFKIVTSKFTMCILTILKLYVIGKKDFYNFVDSPFQWTWKRLWFFFIIVKQGLIWKNNVIKASIDVSNVSNKSCKLLSYAKKEKSKHKISMFAFNKKNILRAPRLDVPKTAICCPRGPKILPVKWHMKILICSNK